MQRSAPEAKSRSAGAKAPAKADYKAPSALPEGPHAADPAMASDGPGGVNGGLIGALPAAGFDFRRIPIDPATGRTEKSAPGLPTLGEPLAATVRRRWETELGVSLGGIRIHEGAAAATAAEALGAEAFTRGPDIVFNQGRYQPYSAAGERLLAHELVHAVQQWGRPASAGSLPVSQPGDRVEREAERGAAALIAGQSPRIAVGAEPYAIHRQPKRANKFLPAEREQLLRAGGNELTEIIDKIIADGSYHEIRRETINGVEHIFEVKSTIIELSEEEQVRGAMFGGAISPDTTVPENGGKTIRHKLGFMLRGGRVSTVESALHELIHMRIMIDRTLPPAERSHYFNEYAKQNELTEVMPGTKFGADEKFDKKSEFGAMPIVAGTTERIGNVLRRISAMRGLIANKDPDAGTKFDADPELAPAALIEFLTQEKYVSQTAAKQTSARGFFPNNDTVARRYARAIMGKFMRSVSEQAQKAFTGAVGQKELQDRVDFLQAAIKSLFDAVDAASGQASTALGNIGQMAQPPTNPSNTGILENRPLDIEGKPVAPPM
ncbi:MAG TPA: DUF4157 domain-containing protein [Terracidiphilus sp.]|jgi:hypothetical protein|nr:DUF4157 domain-containing protein [Terracidiphilus sp.]